jgi:hypothetical protein
MGIPVSTPRSWQETSEEFLDLEKTHRDDILATGFTPSDDLRLVIFLMSLLLSKYSIIWDTMKEQGVVDHLAGIVDSYWYQ